MERIKVAQEDVSYLQLERSRDIVKTIVSGVEFNIEHSADVR